MLRLRAARVAAGRERAAADGAWCGDAGVGLGLGLGGVWAGWVDWAGFGLGLATHYFFFLKYKICFDKLVFQK